jgi:hypothetical protein
MQELWNDKPHKHKLSWWNLQCYYGSSENRYVLPLWINALAKVVGTEAVPFYLVPALAVACCNDGSYPLQCPFGSDSSSQRSATFRTLVSPTASCGDTTRSSHPLCNGQNSLATYVKAIKDGLQDNCP